MIHIKKTWRRSLLVAFAACFFPILDLQAKGLDVDVFPIAVISTNIEHIVARKSKKWEAHRDAESMRKIYRDEPENRYRLEGSDMEILKNCLAGVSCESPLSLKNLEHIDSVDSKKNNLNSDIMIQKLSPEILIAVEKLYPSTAMIINAKSGKLVPQIRSAKLSAIDTRLSQVVSSVCTYSSSYECDLFSTDLEGKGKRLIAHTKHLIVDLEIKDGVIYGLAKTPSNVFHLSSSLLSWSGHAPSYEDWYMLEIEMETKEVKESLLIEDVRNASGYFLNKWKMQSRP